MTVAVVFPSGDEPDSRILDDLPETGWVVAADAGADHARRLGIRVDVVVGDLDSIDAATLDGLGPDTVVHQHPVDKDTTDLQLALDLVAEQTGIESVIVVGGIGGRFDHLLGNATVLSSAAYAGLDIVWLAGDARVTVVHDHARIHGHPGDVVSIIPMGGSAGGVSTTGLRWVLTDDDLVFGSGRGVSNEMTLAVAEVAIRSGCVMVVQPHAVLA